MKSLFEKSSRVKLGPLGKGARDPDPALSIRLVQLVVGDAGGGSMERKQRRRSVRIACSGANSLDQAGSFIRCFGIQG